MNTIKNAPLALVTGASRGIGRAIAEALAEAGYHLILTCSHTLPDLQEVAACLEEKYGITCTAMAADASKPAAIEKVFASLDHLDVLVNNAGISYIGLLTDMSCLLYTSTVLCYDSGDQFMIRYIKSGIVYLYTFRGHALLIPCLLYTSPLPRPLRSDTGHWLPDAPPPAQGHGFHWCWNRSPPPHPVPLR